MHTLDNSSNCLTCALEKFQVTSTGFEPLTSVMLAMKLLRPENYCYFWGSLLKFCSFLFAADGLGVRRDYKMAIKFFNLASQTGEIIN